MENKLNYIIILLVVFGIVFAIAGRNIMNDVITLNNKIDYLTKKVIQLDNPKIIGKDTIITIITIDTVYQIKELE